MPESAASAAASEPEDAFETSARAVSEFVVRTTVLPVTLFFAKPKELARGAAAGDTLALPTPFLLALITGVAISGVTANADKLFAGQEAGNDQQRPEFVKAVMASYKDIEGVQAILAAVPYMLGLWLFASLVSLLMLRGMKESRTLFASLSWSLSAIFMLAAAAIFATYAFQNLGSSFALGVSAAFFVYILFLASKLVRLLLGMRHERNSGWIGAALASLFAFAVMFFTGAAAAGGSYFVYEQREVVKRQQIALLLDSAAKAVEEKDWERAFQEFDRAIELDPRNYEALVRRAGALRQQGMHSLAVADLDRALGVIGSGGHPIVKADLHNERCWTRALWGEELAAALEDCNEALRLAPDQPNILDSRALVHLKQNRLPEALADYDAAIRMAPEFAHARYGRGIVLLRQNKAADSKLELAAALALDPTVKAQFEQELGAADDRETPVPVIRRGETPPRPAEGR